MESYIKPFKLPKELPEKGEFCGRVEAQYQIQDALAEAEEDYKSSALLFTGPPGCGKTSLAYRFHEPSKKQPNRAFIPLTSGMFINDEPLSAQIKELVEPGSNPITIHLDSAEQMSENYIKKLSRLFTKQADMIPFVLIITGTPSAATLFDKPPFNCKPTSMRRLPHNSCIDSLNTWMKKISPIVHSPFVKNNFFEKSARLADGMPMYMGMIKKEAQKVLIEHQNILSDVTYEKTEKRFQESKNNWLNKIMVQRVPKKQRPTAQRMLASMEQKTIHTKDINLFVESCYGGEIPKPQARRLISHMLDVGMVAKNNHHHLVPMVPGIGKWAIEFAPEPERNRRRSAGLSR